MHTDQEIQRAAKLAEEFDPSDVPMDDTTDLRTIAEAVDVVRAGEARVRESVALARWFVMRPAAHKESTVRVRDACRAARRVRL